MKIAFAVLVKKIKQTTLEKAAGSIILGGFAFLLCCIILTIASIHFKTPEAPRSDVTKDYGTRKVVEIVTSEIYVYLTRPTEVATHTTVIAKPPYSHTTTTNSTTTIPTVQASTDMTTDIDEETENGNYEILE